MKKRLSFFCMALLVLLSANVADAQLLHRGGGHERAAFQGFGGDLLQPGLPGRMWIQGNFADQGLGYSGSYFTLGAKSRIFQDRLDGRWLVESQIHHSIEEDGGLFANIGIERVFSIAPANADVSVGFFYDYDGDDQQSFSNSFHQVGVSGAIKTPKWDLLGNGYFPVGTDNYTLGDHTGAICFVGNNIALQSGLESALRGFDVTLRTRPRQLAFVNGTFDIGGYHYDSDIVDSFGGGRLRLGFQVLNGMTITAEVNHDDRFDTTGVLGVGWVFGSQVGGRGNEWAGLARDLERTNRQDHIVRFSQDLVLAIDPDTGLAYNVVHADNTAEAAAGDGSFETPFATLAEAEAASAENDIIFVAGGDGTSNGYDTGITLKDNQFLLGAGGTQLVPLASGGNALVSGKPGSSKATISNPGGNEVVRLADNNVVGGLTIDATGATFGVFGQGVTGGQFNEAMISGATQDGIRLQNIAGDWSFRGNMVTDNGQDGIFVNGSFDPASNFTFADNDVSDNGRDGIHMLNYDADTIMFTDNTTSRNARHGAHLENGLKSDGLGDTVIFNGHIADDNGSDGIRVDGGMGNLRIIDSLLTNNQGNGVTVRNWTNATLTDSVIIGSTAPNTSQFLGNGNGVAVLNENTGMTSTVTLTGSIVDENARGIFAFADGEDSVLNFWVLDNVSISNNASDGIRMAVDDGAVINNRIENTNGFALPIVNNSSDGGSGIAYVLDGTIGLDVSQINSVVRNVNIDTNAAGAEGISIDGIANSQANIDVADSTSRANIPIDINFDNDQNNDINRTYFDNMIIRGDSFAVRGNSGDGTLWDFSLTNSDLQSNGVLAATGEVLDPANPAAYSPYSDTQGDFGIFITAVGGGAPGDLFDNLTRINIENTVIRDFTFNAVNLQTFGDAQMLVNMNANNIFNNGPGNNNDTDADGIFETPSSGAAAVDPLESFFFDAVVLQANGSSTLSARMTSNGMVDNFQQGLVIETTGQGTVNSVLTNNRFSNDIGGDNTNPAGVILDQNIQDMIVTNAVNGNICIDMSNNTFRLPALFDNNGAVANFQVGLDGASNGFTGLPGNVTPVGFGLCDGLLTAEELFFQVSGGFPAN